MAQRPDAVEDVKRRVLEAVERHERLRAEEYAESLLQATRGMLTAAQRARLVRQVFFPCTEEAVWKRDERKG